MADKTTFLDDHRLALLDEPPFLGDSEPPTPNTKPFISMDSMIEQCISKFGWAQFAQAVLVSLSWLFDAQQTFISVFTDSDPSWRCTDNTKCLPGGNLCGLPDGSWAWDEAAGHGHSSVVSEWGLQCATPFVRGLPASSFFVGCLIGGILLATLADSSFGRRNLLLFSCLSMGVSSLLTAFTSSIWQYAALRFVSGFWRGAIGTCALVLSTELVSKQWRGPVGMFGFLGFSAGFFSLPMIAYTNRGSSWRNLYFWTSIPTLFYCILVYFFVRESPRWLLVRGRKDEAFKTLKSISAPEQQSRLTTSFFSISASLDECDDPSTASVDHFSAMKLLFTKRWSLLRLSSVMAAGLGIGMVYYGMPLGLTNLSFNLYLGVAFNALSELPSTLIAILLIAKLNRRSCLLILTTVSAVFSIACAVTVEPWNRFQMWFELISFAGGNAALGVLLIYTLELFPTVVRNSAVSMVRQALVLGGTVSPVIVAAGRASGGSLSYGVLGAAIGCCGVFTVCLPETRGDTLCNTMEEEEVKMAEHRSSSRVESALLA